MLESLLPGVQHLQNIHPIMVHFPIAFLVGAALFYALAWISQEGQTCIRSVPAPHPWDPFRGRRRRNRALCRGGGDGFPIRPGTSSRSPRGSHAYDTWHECCSVDLGSVEKALSQKRAGPSSSSCFWSCWGSCRLAPTMAPGWSMTTMQEETPVPNPSSLRNSCE